MLVVKNAKEFLMHVDINKKDNRISNAQLQCNVAQVTSIRNKKKHNYEIKEFPICWRLEKGSKQNIKHFSPFFLIKFVGKSP